ncbi:MAG TPA: hypothetical protein VFH73_10185 [Polyangia bacterium]|jgi:hypothetical protein|nr:hypothetical protein [Polyangia bacterium]
MTEDVHTPRHLLETLAVSADPSQAPAARRHVATCQLCKLRLDCITCAADAYLASYPADDFSHQVAVRARLAERGGVSAAADSRSRPTVPRRRLFAGLAVLAMAAGAVALWVRLAPRTLDEIRYKGGGVSWAVFAKRGDRTWAVADGDILRPGDRLAFTTYAPQDRFLLMFGIDDAGTIVQYGPQTSTPLRLPRGQGSVPFAIELDARPGEERLFALFSPAPLDTAEARRALAAAAVRARRENRWVTAADLTLPAEITSFGFKKR